MQFGASVAMTSVDMKSKIARRARHRILSLQRRRHAGALSLRSVDGCTLPARACAPICTRFANVVSVYTAGVYVHDLTWLDLTLRTQTGNDAGKALAGHQQTYGGLV